MKASVCLRLQASWRRKKQPEENTNSKKTKLMKREASISIWRKLSIRGDQKKMKKKNNESEVDYSMKKPEAIRNSEGEGQRSKEWRVFYSSLQRKSHLKLSREMIEISWRHENLFCNESIVFSDNESSKTEEMAISSIVNTERRQKAETAGKSGRRKSNAALGLSEEKGLAGEG